MLAVGIGGKGKNDTRGIIDPSCRGVEEGVEGRNV